MRWPTLSAAVLVAAFCHSGHAAVTIDPNNVGATDVFLFEGDPPWDFHVTLVGNTSHGELLIDDGSVVSGGAGLIIGRGPGSVGVVTVNGPGSYLGCPSGPIWVGHGGDASLLITNGAKVAIQRESLISLGPSTGSVTVDGIGSTWSIRSYLKVGLRSTLNITGGGLVDVLSTLRIPTYADGNGFVNMASGGMLALNGEADGSIFNFLDLVEGTDAIRYWDTSLPGWAPITAATEGVDYTLEYLTSGDLAAYTMLTVHAVPEPASLVLGFLALVTFATFQMRR